MATKAKAVPQKDEAPEKEAPETPTTDSPLLDLSDAAVRKMIKLAKKRGWVTHDQINAVMPSEEVTSDQIEDVFSMLNEMGINVVEQEEAEADEEEKGEAEDDDTDNEVVEVTAKPIATTEKKEPTDRTDDPVRMYLREMGSVELLSREGEIAIAKRIEAGREAMISGLCESPLTFQAIIIWRDELNDSKIFLRDIIDLEATYAGPEGKNAAPAAPNGNGDAGATIAAPPAAPTGPTPFKPPSGRPDARPAGDETEGLEGANLSDDDDDEFENSLSLAAIEAELKPKVLETFDAIADSYKKLRRLQDQDIANKLQNETLSPAQERKYK